MLLVAPLMAVKPDDEAPAERFFTR